LLPAFLAGEYLERETGELRGQFGLGRHEPFVFQTQAFGVGKLAVALLVDFLDRIKFVFRRQQLAAFDAEASGR
jgi:hypothetical protein